MEYLNRISFTCWIGDKPLDVQLEPEAFVYTVSPGEELTFVGVCSDNKFKWVLRNSDGGIQLFPESVQLFYTVRIYKNGIEIPNLAN